MCFPGPPRHLTTSHYAKATSGTLLSTDYILRFVFVGVFFFDNLASVRPSACLHFFSVSLQKPSTSFNWIKSSYNH